MPPQVFCAGSKKSRSDGTGSCIDRWRDAAVMPGVEAHVSYPASTASMESRLRGWTERSATSSVIGVIAIATSFVACAPARAADSEAMPSTARFSDSAVGWSTTWSVDPGHVWHLWLQRRHPMKISKLPLPHTHLTAKELT